MLLNNTESPVKKDTAAAFGKPEVLLPPMSKISSLKNILGLDLLPVRKSILQSFYMHCIYDLSYKFWTLQINVC